MPPNLRPTLSNRIRASLDGKRSKSNAQKPQETSKFVVQDAATLRDAIGQAISNDTFQNAIAAHLARLIEPSIKDALDTIQPVVETVYQHDILLRKTNRSVEDLLQRFDSAAEKEEHEPTNKVSKDVTGAEDIKNILNEHSIQNNTRFEELSSSVREGHGSIDQVVTDIGEIRAAMSISSKSLKSLESTTLQSTTDNFKLQEQLDELKVDISNIRKSIDSQKSTLVRINEAELATAQILGDVQQSHASHTLALNEIKAHDQSFKSASIPIFEKTHADTAAAFQTLTARLAAVNENVTASSASENDKILGLGTKCDKLLTSIDTISTKDSSHEILTAVRKSNDFHTIHVAALEGIMDKLATPDAEKDISGESGGLISLKEQVRDIATTLDSHTNHLTAIRESDRSSDILAAVHASNEYHANSGADLGEIKAATKATEQSHISHSADLAEIKAAAEAAGNSHASHAKAFGNLQAAVTTANESHNSHTAALEAIRAANDNSAQGMTSQVKSLEALGSQMGIVIATLGSQSIVHSDIRDTVHASQDAHTSHTVDLGEVKEIVKAVGESHTAHERALENIKNGQQGTIEQLATHARTLDGVQAQVGTVVNNLGEQTAVHSEILDAVHTSNASHASHTTALEDIIAAHNNTSTQLTKHTTTLDAVRAQLGTINTTLNLQNTTHSQLLDAVQASNASHESHAVALDKAETMHADILSGMNGSRGILVGHHEILASQASLLESARDAHSKNHDDIMDAVKQSHGLLESQSGAIRGMESSHEQIRSSVQALGGGVHLNENGLGQLRDHMKVSVAQRSEPASETAEAVREPHSLDDGKTALGLGMAAVAGGGLLAVTGSDGFYHHEGEKSGEAPLDKTSVEETVTGTKDVDKARLSESVDEVTEPVESTTLGEPVAEVHNPIEDITAEPQEKDQVKESIPIVPEEVDQVEEKLPIQRVEADQVEDTILSKTEEVHQSEETIPDETEDERQIEKNTPFEPTGEVADSTKEISDPAEETKPVEQGQEELEPVHQKDLAVDEPAHEIESTSKDEDLSEDSARKLGSKLAIEGQSVNEPPIQEPSHETLGDEITAEKDLLNRESAQLNEFAPAPTPAPEPEAESIHEKELVQEDGPAIYEAAAKGPPLTESCVEQPVQDLDRGLEEPVDAVLPGHTIETVTTGELIHEESGKESKAEHNEALNELPLDEKPSLEEQFSQERGLSYEVEPEHDVKWAEDGASVMENIADVPIHESEIPVEPGSITGEQSVHKLLSVHEPEPQNVIEGKRDESALVSKPDIIPQNIGESVLDSKNEQGTEEPPSEVLAVDGSAVISHGIASKLADEVPLVEPVTMESAMRTRNTGAERRPTLTKRVSFKEPPTEEKLNPDKHVESRPLSTEETIMEEQHSDTSLPIGDDPANEGPSGGVQEKSSTVEDKPTLEDSHINTPGVEVEPYKEEASLDEMPTLAIEKLAEDESSGLDPSNHEILQPTIEEPRPSPSQTPETELAKESNPIKDESVLSESGQKELALHSLATNDVEVRHEEGKPMGDKEANQVTDSNAESVLQHEIHMRNEKLEQFPVEEKIGESEPATDDSSPKHESTKEPKVEPKGEAELHLDHSTLEDFSPGDHAMKDADEKSLDPNNSASQKLVMDTQSGEAATETLIVKPKPVSEEVPPAIHSSTTEDFDVKSREEPIADEPITSEISTQDHAGYEQTVNYAKHGSIDSGQIAEHAAIYLPVTTNKDESEGPAANERIVDKPSVENYVNEPASTIPILQASPVNDAVVDEPPILEAQNENPTIIQPMGITNKIELENSTGEPVAAPHATPVESIIENPVLHNQAEEDLAENSMAVSAADNKLAVNGSVVEENAVESKAVEEPVLQNSLAVKSDEETKAHLEKPDRETTMEELSGTEPLYSTKVDTSANINPTKFESDQPEEVKIKDQDEPTAKESKLEEHALSDDDPVFEGSHRENMSLEDEKLYEEPKAENSDSKIESPAKGASLKAEPVTTGVVEDAKSAVMIDSTRENADISVETLRETETHLEESTMASEHGEASICHVESETALENEPFTKTAQAPEKGHAEDEIAPNQLPIRDQIDLPAPTYESAGKESNRYESPSDEPTDDVNVDKSSSTPPLIVHPTRVDSGIEIETPTEAKSTFKTESLDTIVTGPLSNSTNQIDPSIEIGAKDLNVASTSTEEEVSGIKSHEDELVAKSATLKPNPETEPIPDQLGDESQDAMDRLLEEDQVFDAVDESDSRKLSAATVESSVKTASAGDWINGNSAQEIISADPTTETSSEKELQLDTKHSTKEQHTRMDSGIDVETPTTEPLGKLQPVVEVKPASDVEPGLEGGI